MFPLISVNMIYTNEADLRLDNKLQDTITWVTHFWYFVLVLKLLSGDRSQILRIASNELLNTHKFP